MHLKLNSVTMVVHSDMNGIENKYYEINTSKHSNLLSIFFFLYISQGYSINDEID